MEIKKYDKLKKDIGKVIEYSEKYIRDTTESKIFSHIKWKLEKTGKLSDWEYVGWHVDEEPHFYCQEHADDERYIDYVNIFAVFRFRNGQGYVEMIKHCIAYHYP